jgi:hypothetical protein
VLTIASPAATPFALAFWTDAARLRVRGRPAIAAGRAGVVVPLVLRSGVQTIEIDCAGCSSSVLPYAT